MSRSKHASKARRSKPYTPRPLNRIAAFDALHANHQEQIKAAKVAELRQSLKLQLDDSRQRDLSIAYRIAFEGLINGTAVEDDWHVVAFSMNIAVVLCERGFGPEYEADIVAALDAIFRIGVEQKKTGKWTFNPASNDTDCRAIEHAFDVHEAQVAVVTQAELMSAVGEVHNRMDQKNVYEEAA